MHFHKPHKFQKGFRGANSYGLDVCPFWVGSSEWGDVVEHPEGKTDGIEGDSCESEEEFQGVGSEY